MFIRQYKYYSSLFRKIVFTSDKIMRRANATSGQICLKHSNIVHFCQRVYNISGGSLTLNLFLYIDGRLTKKTPADIEEAIFLILLSAEVLKAGKTDKSTP